MRASDDGCAKGPHAHALHDVTLQPVGLEWTLRLRLLATHVTTPPSIGALPNGPATARLRSEIETAGSNIRSEIDEDEAAHTPGSEIEGGGKEPG